MAFLNGSRLMIVSPNSYIENVKTQMTKLEI